MANFKPLVDTSVKEAEAKVFDYWQDIDILERTLEKGQNSKLLLKGLRTTNRNSLWLYKHT